MANTICILLVASLFVLSNAIPVNPGIVKGVIHKKSGETRGLVNAALGISVKSALDKATTDEQRTCIKALKAEVFQDANLQINQTTRALVTMAESHAAEMSNVTLDDVNKAVDAMFKNIKEQWLPEKIAEIQKC
uniref:Secreted venom family 1 protein n=1 Tax=Pristhesancus plagipennis TaxID=1955184 RepID=A0A2K8JLY1_PRIPG|nr:secreted venom family 1 protein [Pristhesancus plagipennis]